MVFIGDFAPFLRINAPAALNNHMKQIVPPLTTANNK